jgi:homoserine dehydrogenase
METNARRGTSAMPSNVSSGVLSGSANWIITNFSVGVAYSESVITAAAISISAPVSGSNG